jgi:hypothetical protein
MKNCLSSLDDETNQDSTTAQGSPFSSLAQDSPQDDEEDENDEDFPPISNYYISLDLDIDNEPLRSQESIKTQLKHENLENRKKIKEMIENER